jgi:hypothetical protein
VLAWIGMRKLERFENPLGTARRRMDDHIEWWQTRVLVSAPGRPVGEGRGSRARDEAPDEAPHDDPNEDEGAPS